MLPVDFKGFPHLKQKIIAFCVNLSINDVILFYFNRHMIKHNFQSS